MATDFLVAVSLYIPYALVMFLSFLCLSHPNQSRVYRICYNLTCFPDTRQTLLTVVISSCQGVLVYFIDPNRF